MYSVWCTYIKNNFFFIILLILKILKLDWSLKMAFQDTRVTNSLETHKR